MLEELNKLCMRWSTVSVLIQTAGGVHLSEQRSKGLDELTPDQWAERINLRKYCPSMHARRTRTALA